MAVGFEWDNEKARQNFRKHGISFAEATSLFTSGADYLEIYDADHSDEEERFLCIGQIARGIVLVVIAEVDKNVMRIISARRATRRESLFYGHFLKERFRG